VLLSALGVGGCLPGREGQEGVRVRELVQDRIGSCSTGVTNPVAEVRLSTVALEDLDRLILTHSLPADTRARVKRSLGRFPRLGRKLQGRWSPFRFTSAPGAGS
jgi:hypothetical protein